MSLKRNENYSEWYDDIRIMHDKFGAKEWVRRQFEARNFKLLNDFLANKSRKNPFGLPDMVKPEGWKGPEITKYDCGILSDIFESEKERLQMLREKRDLENEFKGQVANLHYE